MSTFVQVLNPAAFEGAEAFDRQTSFIAACARASPPAANGQPVTSILCSSLADCPPARAHTAVDHLDCDRIADPNHSVALILEASYITSRSL